MASVQTSAVLTILQMFVRVNRSSIQQLPRTPMLFTNNSMSRKLDFVNWRPVKNIHYDGSTKHGGVTWLPVTIAINKTIICTKPLSSWQWLHLSLVSIAHDDVGESVFLSLKRLACDTFEMTPKQNRTRRKNVNRHRQQVAVPHAMTRLIVN